MRLSRAGEALAAARVAAGAGAWLAPGLAARILGVEPTPGTKLVLRLFGARELAVGAAYLEADAATRDRLLVLGMGMDGADAVAAVIGGGNGAVGWPKAVMLTLAAAGAVVTASQIRRG